jgi:hypothetical protein
LTPRQYVQFKHNAAVAATLGPSPGGIRGLRAAPGPQFQDVNGNIISSIACGQPYVFDVPGYSSVNLVLLKNGAPDFSGGFNVPMPPYTANCMTDPGVYQATAYDQVSGANLGTVTFTVEQPTGTTGAITGTVNSIFGNLSTTEIAAGAILLLLLLKKKGRKKA